MDARLVRWQFIAMEEERVERKVQRWALAVRVLLLTVCVLILHATLGILPIRLAHLCVAWLRRWVHLRLSAPQRRLETRCWYVTYSLLGHPLHLTHWVGALLCVHVRIEHLAASVLGLLLRWWVCAHLLLVLRHVLLIDATKFTAHWSLFLNLTRAALRWIRNSVRADWRILRTPLVLGSRIFSRYYVDEEVEHVALRQSGRDVGSL